MRYGIALGSNLGDRLAHLRSAVRELLREIPSAQLLEAAPVYETEPMDCPEESQPFYNTVIELEADLAPLPLLDILLAIEVSLGRRRDHERNAPRTIDLDLLYAEDITMADPKLTLPHPRMVERRFVLEPLSKIRPNYVPSGQTKTIQALLNTLESEKATTRLVETNWLRQK